jgi:predicted transcriptional regulator
MSRKKSTRLGELETEVMGIVWERGEVSVQDVRDALEPERPLAYTTVMTVMSRLFKKGLLERRKEGRAYIYYPGSTQEKLAGSILRSLVERLYAGATGQAIAHLLETEAEVDEEELDRLEALIRARREAGEK